MRWENNCKLNLQEVYVICEIVSIGGLHWQGLNLPGKNTGQLENCMSRVGGNNIKSIYG
jgi:hypothetical protein